MKNFTKQLKISMTFILLFIFSLALFPNQTNAQPNVIGVDAGSPLIYKSLTQLHGQEVHPRL